ncbi:MAG: hypothetical protein DRN57_00150 [Thermoplasmata archaeon]|nr:MAG: hypothetical protein DRN57_00150 [Thermoplasmata archaeon]
MDPVRAGVAGVGKHGMRYIKHMINDVPEMELSGVVRGDPSKGTVPELEEAGVPMHPSLEGLLSSGVDLLVVAAPTSAHLPAARRALERGVHVLLEKPMASDPEECRELLDAERRSDATLTVAHTLRYSPSILRVRELLSGREGVLWFEMAQTLEPPRNPWLKDGRARGGCVLNTGVHLFDAASFIFGSPVSQVECRLERLKNPMWEDHAYGSMVLSSGLEGAFRISRVSGSRTRYVRVDLENEVLWADVLTETVFHVFDGSSRKEEMKGEKRAIIPLLSDMVNVVRGNMKPPVTGEDGMRAVEAAWKCYRRSAAPQTVWNELP